MISVLLYGLPGWLAAIVEASVYATIVAVLVLALQMVLGRKIPAGWRFALWFLVLVRLVPLPLPESQASLFNVFGTRIPEMTTAAPTPVAVATPRTLVPEIMPAVTADQPIVIAEPQAAPETHIKAPAAATEPPVVPVTTTVTAAPITQHAFPWKAVSASIYAGGAGLFALRQLLATRALIRMMKAGCPAQDPRLLASLDAARSMLGIKTPLPLLLLSELSSPALVGYFRPRLLLPADVVESLSSEDLRHIFLHECAHLKRRDVLLNYLIALLTMLHWFNPVVHLLLPRIRADRELATDELVLAHTEPASYGQTLLNLFETGMAPGFPSKAPASVAITETRSFFTRRIHMIARYQKRPAWLAVPAMITLAVASACTLTAPLSHADDAQGQRATVAQQDRAPSAKPATRPAVADPTPVAGTWQGGRTMASNREQPDFRSTAEIASDQANSATRARLDEKLESLQVDQQAVEKVMQYLQDASHVNFHINWAALGQAGMDKNTPVSARMSNIPFRRALVGVLTEAVGSAGRLGYTVEDGVVIISTMDDLRSAAHACNRVYNIREFLDASQDVGEQTGALIDIIKANVAPDTWRDSGGELGSIKDFNGLLTVTTSSDVHYEISELLATMSRANAGAPIIRRQGGSEAVTKANAEEAYAQARAARDALAAVQARQAVDPRDMAGDAELRALQGQLYSLEQEHAAMIARGGGNASVAELKSLEARIKTVKDQLADTHDKLQARADEEKAIREKREAESKASQLTEIYDVRLVAGIPETGQATLTAEQRASVEDLANTLRRLTGVDSISAFNGQIIVNAPSQVHDQVNRLLQQLRERKQNGLK